MIHMLVLVAGTALILFLSSELVAQKAISERCSATSSRHEDSQPIPEQLKVPKAPKTARQVSFFHSFNRSSTMTDVVRKCGIPDEHLGSGLYLFVHYMNDCSTVSVSTGDLQHLGIKHVKQGKSTVLLKY